MGIIHHQKTLYFPIHPRAKTIFESVRRSRKVLKNSVFQYFDLTGDLLNKPWHYAIRHKLAAAPLQRLGLRAPEGIRVAPDAGQRLPFETLDPDDQ